MKKPPFILKHESQIIYSISLTLILFGYAGVLYLLEPISFSLSTLLSIVVFAIVYFVIWAINETITMRKFKLMIRKMERENNEELKIDN